VAGTTLTVPRGGTDDELAAAVSPEVEEVGIE
jgi:hypothetical protein